MNNLSKILLIITLILAIALVTVTCLYFNTNKLLDYYTDGCLANADLLVKTNIAIESAGFYIELQEDGTFKLVEKIVE